MLLCPGHHRGSHQGSARERPTGGGPAGRGGRSLTTSGQPSSVGCRLQPEPEPDEPDDVHEERHPETTETTSRTWGNIAHGSGSPTGDYLPGPDGVSAPSGPISWGYPYSRSNP